MMDKVKNAITRILSIWAGIGVMITVVAAQGFFQIPDGVAELFSQDTAVILQGVTDSVIVAIGSILSAYQVIRGFFAAQKLGAKGTVSVLGTISTRRIALNPFAAI